MQKNNDRSKIILQVNQLSKHYDISGGWFKRKKQILKAVDQVSFAVHEGETLGIVGESGCGKTTLGNVIIHLTDPTSGKILFDNIDFCNISHKMLRQKRRDIQMIFQDPFSSLNPRMKVFDIVAEPLKAHRIVKGKKLKEEVYNILEAVGLSPDCANRFPQQFSGGQRQRIGIGRALALKPKLIICDEPVSALDVSIQSQILNLLVDLQKRYKLTYIFIAHGMPVIAYVSDRIAVMYMGSIVEIAGKDDLLNNPTHPYTEGLLASIPISDPGFRGQKTKVLEGEIPNPLNPPSGCTFHTRCPYVRERCKTERPLLKVRDSNRFVACHYPLKTET